VSKPPGPTEARSAYGLPAIEQLDILCSQLRDLHDFLPTYDLQIAALSAAENIERVLAQHKELS